MSVAVRAGDAARWRIKQVRRWRRETMLEVAYLARLINTPQGTGPAAQHVRAYQALIAPHWYEGQV